MRILTLNGHTPAKETSGRDADPCKGLYFSQNTVILCRRHAVGGQLTWASGEAEALEVVKLNPRKFEWLFRLTSPSIHSPVHEAPPAQIPEFHPQQLSR